MPKLKLSDAIMLNGMTKPQGFGPSSVFSIDAPCAIGGALQAIGKQNSVIPYLTFKSEWPWTHTELSATCPAACAFDATCPAACAFVPFNAAEAIWHLNDEHKWTRQQIAEWVARIEPAEIPANVTCEATVVRHCEDSGELCGKTCVEGSYLCAEHEAEVGNGH